MLTQMRDSCLIRAAQLPECIQEIAYIDRHDHDIRDGTDSRGVAPT